VSRVLVRLVEPGRDSEDAWLARVPVIDESVIFTRKGWPTLFSFSVEKVTQVAAPYENAVNHVEAYCVGTFREAQSPHG
jgi:hypothetical protein